jgi:peptidylprolyl isomerase
MLLNGLTFGFILITNSLFSAAFVLHLRSQENVLDRLCSHHRLLAVSTSNPISCTLLARNALSRSVQVGGLIAAVALQAQITKAVDTELASLIMTESGLQYKDIKVGDGSSPIAGDTVRVHYTGWLEGFDSEKKFDSSYDRRSPLAFKVGVRQVIAGWDEGLLTNMKVGGKRELVIPPSLGYGARGVGGFIPPNATLYFRIELIGVGR